MQHSHHRNQKEAGIVSLFVVIFAALLITTITIAFVRMMITAQQQATANDLSKSALDSAYAGIEDAKRLTVRYIKSCLDENYLFITTSEECDRMQAAINANKCNTIQSSPLGNEPNAAEVQIGTTVGKINMDQAYTCVKVNLTPNDYLGTLNQNAPILVPLKVEDNKKVGKITIEWYSPPDLPGINADNITMPRMDEKLISLDRWNSGKFGPPPLRVQLIQHVINNIEISSFDESRSDSVNSAVLFLKPYDGLSSTAINSANFGNNYRGSTSMSPSESMPKGVSCLKSVLAAGGFACKVEITIPNPIGAADDRTPRSSYILLSQNYVPRSSFRITLDGSTKNFYFVQAKVDSTGRANDFFRRLDVRLNLYPSSMSMPQASIDTVNRVCKPLPDEDLVGFSCPES